MLPRFTINEYKYKDKNTGFHFIFYSRTMQFANELAKRITNLGLFDLVPLKFKFCKNVVTDIPPYEIEIEQQRTIQEWERRTQNTNE